MYNLGIDIGIASIGFAGVDIAKEKILFTGAHIFEAAENPKDKSSLAKPRREKRGARRITSRRSQRKRQIRALLARHDIKDIQAIDKKPSKNDYKSPWELRKDAFNRLLTDAELARVLFHMAKRRGFQSNKKGVVGDNDTEGKKVLQGATDLEEKWMESGETTIAAFLSTQSKQRNGDGDYSRSVKRDMIREEVVKIFEAQQKFGNTKATKELLNEYAGSGLKEERNTREGDGIAFYQRPLQSSEKLVGYCTFEKEEKRAPKYSYTAELFVMWSKINNLKIKDTASNERFLTIDEKQKIAEQIHKTKRGATYKAIRKLIDMNDQERFNIGYRKIKDDDNTWDAIKDRTEATTFMKLEGYHLLKDALENNSAISWHDWTNNKRDILDDIVRILSFNEDRKLVDEMLSSHHLSEQEKQNLCKITKFSKTLDLSLKAIRNILPFMQQGMKYDEACKEAGYHHSKTHENGALEYIPPFDDVKNPVVNRAMAQARKVINACIRKYGKPEKIIIELARDVGRSADDRSKIEREQKKNQAYREELTKHAAELYGIIPENVTGEDYLKYRLWKEQEGVCPYSGVYISAEMMRDSMTTQIDHIIPYSRSWDNSYMNKVLCTSDANQDKGNRTPYEWLGGTPLFDKMAAVISKLPPAKQERFLIEEFQEREQGWRERSLNDTRYMSKLLKNHIEQNLNLGEGRRVQTRNGALTAYLRNIWGFAKKNRENDRHHALDAIVIASSTESMVQKMTRWNKYEARAKDPSKRVHPPAPWEKFHKDALNAVDNIFVSRMPVRKITGAAHQETIRSVRKSDGKIIQRVKLSALKPATLENLVDKETRNKKLYETLKDRLDQFNGDPQKAFAEPIYMPVNDPSKTAPHINSVRVETNEKSGIIINEGLASNGDMVRVDVFCKNGKYFLVPIYVHHFTQDTLPNKAIIAYKDETEWEEMNEKDFIFSLYKNDLVQIKSKKNEYYAYYAGLDRATGAVSLRTHDSNPSFGKKGIERSGVKNLLSFEKYVVDYFGNKSKVVKEKRIGVAQHIDTKPSETVSIQGTI